MEVIKMTCINCPLGCSLEAAINEENIKVLGNKCKRGAEYAVNEIKDPKRIVTSTIKVMNGDRLLVSVKTDREIPKRAIFDVMKSINDIKAAAPVDIGEVLLENVLGLGANIVATSRVKIKS